MEVPGHVNMTRDAVLLSAQAVAADADAIVIELHQAGARLDASVFVERRLQALVELLLPDEDDQARLELLYQEKLLQWLQAIREDTLGAARRAALTAAPGAFHEAVNGRH